MYNLNQVCSFLCIKCVLYLNNNFSIMNNKWNSNIKCNLIFYLNINHNINYLSYLNFHNFLLFYKFFRYLKIKKNTLAKARTNAFSFRKVQIFVIRA